MNRTEDIPKPCESNVSFAALSLLDEMTAQIVIGTKIQHCFPVEIVISAPCGDVIILSFLKIRYLLSFAIRFEDVL
jgi:hypothetical protein